MNLNMYLTALLYYTGKNDNDEFLKCVIHNICRLYVCMNYNEKTIIIGLHSKMEKFHISVDFWNQIHINEIKQPKELLLPNLEPEHVLILVKQFFTSTYYIMHKYSVKHWSYTKYTLNISTPNLFVNVQIILLSFSVLKIKIDKFN